MAKMSETPVYLAEEIRRPSASKLTPFQQAFDAARADKKKIFEFPPGSGRRFSTQTAEEQGREIGAKAAAGSGRGASAGRTAADRDTTSGRAEIPKGGAAGPAARGERMSPFEMGLLTTSGALAAPLLAKGAATAYRAGAPMVRKGVEAAKSGASKGVEAVKGMMERRAAAEGAKRTAREEAKGDGPAMYGDMTPPKVGGVFRSARPPAPKPTPAPKPEPPKSRVQVEGTKGGVYRSSKDEASAKPKSEFRSRTADRMDEREMLKKGGTTKAYAKGGSVRGAGCEARSKKTRYV